MYLVIARTNLDDLPISLHKTEGEAKTAAESLTEEQIDHATKLMQVDAAGFAAVGYVKFNSSGELIRLTLVTTPIKLEKEG